MKRPLRVWLWSCLFVAGVASMAFVGMGPTATTRQGINFVVSTHHIPLSVKILDFLHRNAHYRLLAQEVTQGFSSDHERVLAVLDWTRRTIRRTPRGWPIVDDHVLNIIIRGYGLDDQMADAFTTLATYAGVPAFWTFVRPDDSNAILTLSFAKVDGVWTPIDVANGLVFRDVHGRWVDVETVAKAPEFAQSVAQDVSPVGLPYWRYTTALGHSFHVPDVTRAEQQMPWPRLLFEARRALHLSKAEAP